MRNIKHIENDSPPVREALQSDLTTVVRVHKDAFSGFFLDRMGSKFIKAYYQAVLDYRDAIFLVHESASGEVDGFAVGFFSPDIFYQHFRARRLRLMPIIIGALLRRPSLFMEIARNTRRIADVDASEGRVVELSSIGTNRRGTGVGRILLEAFCDRSINLGADEVSLSTDRDENIAVVNFYLNQGFERTAVEERGTRVLQIMRKKLTARHG